MYSCGPTVYGPAHVGNFRAFLLGDLRPPLPRWTGYRVTWVMNITDVDDRIIRDLQAAGGTLDELTAPHIAAIPGRPATPAHRCRPTVLPRATEHIPEMAALIAHAARQGPRLPDRRRLDLLPHLVVADLRHAGPARSRRGQRVGERVAADDYGKDDVRDFALWKGPSDGRADRGRPRSVTGRPGWHIECSAMSMKLPRRVVRHPHRRRRPDLPAPRERDRPVRGGDRTSPSCASGFTTPICSCRARRWRVGSATSPGRPRSTTTGYIAARASLRADRDALPRAAGVGR